MREKCWTNFGYYSGNKNENGNQNNYGNEDEDDVDTLRVVHHVRVGDTHNVSSTSAVLDRRSSFLGSGRTIRPAIIAILCPSAWKVPVLTECIAFLNDAIILVVSFENRQSGNDHSGRRRICAFRMDVGFIPFLVAHQFDVVLFHPAVDTRKRFQTDILWWTGWYGQADVRKKTEGYLRHQHVHDYIDHDKDIHNDGHFLPYRMCAQSFFLQFLFLNCTPR